MVKSDNTIAEGFSSVLTLFNNNNRSICKLQYII